MEFHLTWLQVLTLAVGTVLPLVVGLVTTRVTSPGARAVLLLVLSAIAGLGSEVIDAAQYETTYDLGQGVLMALTTFITGVAVQFGLWRPTGASAAAIDSGRTSTL